MKIRLILPALFLMIISSLLFGEEDIRRNLLTLSPENELFIDEHPVLRVGNNPNWVPFNYSADGEARGIVVDYFTILADILGFKIEWVNGYTWPELQNMVRTKEIDMVLNILPTEEREEYMIFSDPFLQMLSALGYREEIRKTHPVLNLDELSVSYVESYASAENFVNLYNSPFKLPAESPYHAVAAVDRGEVDVTLDNLITLSYLSHEFFNGRIHAERYVAYNPENGYFRIGVRDDWSGFINLINKALPWVYQEERREILERYTGNTDLGIKEGTFYLESPFTSKEIEWLSDNREIDVYILDDFHPTSNINEKGEIEGIVKGYCDELEKRLGLSFQYIPHEQDLTDLYDIKAGMNPYIFSTLTKSDERADSFNFTPPYLELPLMLYGRDNQTYISQISDISSMKVTVVEGHIIGEWLKEDFPDMEIVTSTSTKDSLEEVSDGKADLFIGSAAATSNTLIVNHIKDVSIVGSTPYSYNISMAVSKESTHLRTILSKSLAQIKKDRGSAIESFWRGQKVEAGLDPAIIHIMLQVVFVALIIIIFQARSSYVKHKYLKFNATTDSLTGLKNRRFLNEI